MKLTKEEFKRAKQESAMTLFYQGIKAEETREKYTRTLRQILCKMLEEILDGTFEERVEQLVRYGRENPEWTRDLLLNVSRKMKERIALPRDHQDYLNPVSFGNYFKPIKKLFDMNDVTVPWKRIYATFPEEDNPTLSRGWTRDEIRQMLRFARGPMERALILVCASSGIRAGGFDGLEWRDLVPIYQKPDGTLQMDRTESQPDVKLVCATLQIYRSSNENYPAFITPEAYGAIEDYRSEWTARTGRLPRPDDPIFIKSGVLARRATTVTIKRHVTELITRAGLRDKTSMASMRRYEVPMMNGFRRFWNKTCKETASKDTPLAALIKKEYMMGHSGLVKLDRNYFKTHTLELAEEYLHAVPDLTIDDAERLRESNRLKTAKIRRMEDEKDLRISELEDMVRIIAKRLEK